ncbi:hypothetical protein EPJ93_23380, partial [Mycobacteroides abscessus subsp. abscessus]
AHPSRASQLRCHLFVQQTLSKQELIGFKTTSSTSGRDVDLRIPSFLRISKVLREATETYGFGVVPGGATLYAYD